MSNLIHDLQVLYKELELLNVLYEKNKIAFFRPIGQQPKFFESSTAEIRLALGSNRSGKSVCGAAESVSHAKGFRPWLPEGHPHRIVRLPNGDPIPVPNVGRVLGENFPVSIEQTIWPKIKEWLPEADIAQVKRGQRGYVEKVVLRNGSVIHFMAYKQDIEVFEGTSGYWAWFDEPPPRNIFVAVRRGLIDHGGHVWLTMTPLARPWTYDEIFAKAGDPDGRVRVFTFSIWDNCIDNGGYLSRQAIQSFLDSLRPDEREAREHGRYIHLTGRVFKEWLPEPPFYVDSFEVPKSWPRVCIIDPHPRKPVAVTWIAYSPSGKKYVYRCLWDESLTTIAAVAERIHKLEKEGTGFAEPVVLRLIDTSANQHEKTSGATVMTRFAENGIFCRGAYKKNYWAGIDAMHEDLWRKNDWDDPQLVIMNNCPPVKDNFLKFCFAEWKTSGQEEAMGRRQDVRKTDDDFIDCIKYAYQARLDYKNLSVNMPNSGYLEDSDSPYMTTINMPGTHPGMRRQERQEWRTRRNSGLMRGLG